MSKKKLVLLFSMILLVIGGLMFHVHRMGEEEKLQAQILKEQERMVFYAINRYEGIEKIEFTSFEKNDMTGVWSAGAEINNEYQVVFKAFGFGGDLYMNYGPSKKTGRYLLPKDSVTTIDTLLGLEIIYWRDR